MIPTFFFMVMVASLAATFYIYYLAPKRGLSQIAVLDLSLYGTIFGVIGARLFHIFFEYPGYYWEDPIRVFYFWQGGFVGYGVFIGLALTTIIYVKLKKLPLLKYVDLIAFAGPIIVFFVRVGCIGAGCCYGKPTHFPLHLVFNNPASDAGHDFPGIALHATQIYDMCNAIITFLILHWVDKRKKTDGWLALVFFTAYPIMRFLIEYLRGDTDRGVYLNGMLSTSQITSLVFLSIVGMLALLLRRYHKIHTHSESFNVQQ
ncbi:prolipoprotein diacylglyceryl transferase [bacterium]|nr:prolipoprotein diacylglyceryl transferase [bacterium]